MKIKITTIISSIAISISFISCDKTDKTTAIDNNAASSEKSIPLIERSFISEPPSEFVNIGQARSIPAGKKVTVKGSLIGHENIFVDKAAMFIIGDPEKIEIEEDEAKPWTACCTPPEIIKANTLTVQFLDQDGNLIMQTAKGIKGLKELDTVIISGTMDSSSTPEAPLLNIEHISIVK